MDHQLGESSRSQHSSSSSSVSEEEVWEDAEDGSSILGAIDLEERQLSVDELKRLASRIQQLKTEGNTAFTAKPPDYSAATDRYETALSYVPPVSKIPAAERQSSSGIEQISDEEALAVAQEDTEESQTRHRLEQEIRDLAKTCYGNLAACFAALKDHKKTVEACTKALEYDDTYVKALQRRAVANTTIGSWSSLTTALEDNKKLVAILPVSSPASTTAKKEAASLPSRIAIQQQKEKDEMMGKLKELGNGLLGTFGLHTDMFKFEPQPGGGYGLKFER